MFVDFKAGNRWDMINSLRAGASLGSCGRHADRYDPRPYGVALLCLYPGLLDPDSVDAVRVLSEGVDRGSASMCIAALLAGAPVAAIDWTQRERLHGLIDMAKASPDLSHVFEEDIDF